MSNSVIEPKVRQFRATYLHLFKNDRHPLELTFTNRKKNFPFDTAMHGYYEIEWKGNNEVARDFLLFLNTPYLHAGLDKWLEERMTDEYEIKTN